MMKKIIALLVSCALLLGTVCLAQEAVQDEEMADTVVTGDAVSVSVDGKFTVECTIPDGYQYAEEYVDSITYTGVLADPADPTRPVVTIVIAYDDSYDFNRLNDLDQGRLDAWIEYIRSSYAEIYSEVKAQVLETGLGTKVVLFTAEQNGEYMTELLTVYYGCECAAYVTCLDEEGNMTRVTDEQISLIMQFLTDMKIAAA